MCGDVPCPNDFKVWVDECVSDMDALNDSAGYEVSCDPPLINSVSCFDFLLTFDQSLASESLISTLDCCHRLIVSHNHVTWSVQFLSSFLFVWFLIFHAHLRDGDAVQERGILGEILAAKQDDGDGRRVGETGNELWDRFDIGPNERNVSCCGRAFWTWECGRLMLKMQLDDREGFNDLRCPPSNDLGHVCVQGKLWQSLQRFINLSQRLYNCQRCGLFPPLSCQSMDIHSRMKIKDQQEDEDRG